MKKFLALISAAALSLLLCTCAYAEDKPAPDHLSMMVTAASCGDVEGGRQAEKDRNALIDETGSAELKISFDDLYLLSRFIYYEAGNARLTDELRLCVGEVVLNRVASPEYPDTIEEVIYQEGQYEGIYTEKFESALAPSRACVKAALRLLQGERMLAPQVVFQGDTRMGEVYATFCDRVLGYTYFCESPNLEFYLGAAPEADSSAADHPCEFPEHEISPLSLHAPQQDGKP